MEVFFEENQSKQKSKRKQVLFWFIVLLGIGGGASYALLLMSGPVTSEVKEVDKKYSLDTPSLPPPISQFKGTYFSFSLSETYKKRRHEVSADRRSPTLEQVFFTQLVDPGRKVALTIEQREDGKKEDASSYVFRTQNTKLYQQDIYEWNGKRVTIFLKNDPVYEVLGYVEKDELVASLAVSSAVESPEKLMSDFADILKSFKWVDASVSKNK